MNPNLFAVNDPQIDHNEPGKPWTAHERYQTQDCTGTRRVAYGRTETEALYLGTLNAAAWPVPADVPYVAEVQEMAEVLGMA